MEEKLFFTNSKGNKLAAVLNIINKESLTIVISHAFGNFKDGSAKKLSEKLEFLGINSLRFDFYGHGESEGNISDITVSEGVDDIRSAIKFLKNRDLVKIGLMGISFGGACSILAAAREPSIQSLALRAPVADFLVRELMFRSKEELNKWKETGFREFPKGDGTSANLSYNFFLDLPNNRGLVEAFNITAPTLIIHGDQDERVPFILSEMLQKAIPNATLNVIEGADHIFTNKEQREESLNDMVEFVRSIHTTTV